VPVYAFYYFVRDSLGMAWRRWLTHDFLKGYFEQRAFYQLTYEHNIDNPDQRISEDINSFTQKALKFLVEIVGAAMQLVAFSGILWSISQTLVWFLVLYAALGSLVTFGLFGKPLIRLNFQQLRKEADFRFGLIRVRENAEAIAFYQGEAAEASLVKRRFRELFLNYQALLRRTLGLNLFQYAYTFVTYILPSIIVAPRIISGELEVGRVVQAAGAFASMLAALTVFVDNFELLSGFAAGIDRLHAFRRSLRAEHRKGATQLQRIEQGRSPRLMLEGVTLRTPDSQLTLIQNVSLSVDQGQGLLIVGPSGSGKSSLLRAIAGLWDSGSGKIQRPPLSDMLFLPQRPYMILGSLRQQLLYPHADQELADDQLQQALVQVNLPDLAERCGGFDVELDFGKLLSVGEQQRLAVCRVLLSRPSYVVLDEATSALDADNEQRLYELLSSTGATLVSVTHRPALARFHARVLSISRNGAWRLGPAEARPLSAGSADDLAPVSDDARSKR
jgi:putative ATP-binding cassette transporter